MRLTCSYENRTVCLKIPKFNFMFNIIKNLLWKNINRADIGRVKQREEVWAKLLFLH